MLLWQASNGSPYLGAKWPLSRRGGKSGQEATPQRRKLCLAKDIRPKTLLATAFSKWPGGQFVTPRRPTISTPFSINYSFLVIKNFWAADQRSR